VDIERRCRPPIRQLIILAHTATLLIVRSVPLQHRVRDGKIKLNCIASFYGRHNNYITKKCHPPPTTYSHTTSLLEDLSIRNRFPLHGFIPRPGIAQKLPVLFRRGIKFFEIVGFPIGGNVKGDLVVVAAGKKGTGDGAVIVFAKDDEAAKEEFTRGVEAGEEAGD
jgi:hypothetical protein